MSDRPIIVVGYQGQDGQLLSRQLIHRGSRVFGLGRRKGTPQPGITPIDLDIASASDVAKCVAALRPHEVYYLAAHHRSSECQAAPSIHDDFTSAFKTNSLGPLNFLEAIRLHHPSARFFFASSSLIYGGQSGEQNESTPPSPNCEYGATKLLGSLACQKYRKENGLFASVGILYNHESTLRRPEFLFRRVIDTAVRIANGSSEMLELGSLDVAVDWGYAPDFARAFTAILAHPTPTDFIVATGQAHTIKDLLDAAFGHFGLNWTMHVRLRPDRITRPPVSRYGNPAKLMNETGWRPSLDFEKMVKQIIEDVQAGRESQ